MAASQSAMDDIILHERLPHAPWLEPATWRLPGLQPLEPDHWLVRDEVFSAQMQLRDRLIEERENDVHAFLPGSEPAARECLDLIVEAVRGDPAYAVGEFEILRPDGVHVRLDRARPLITAGRLTQADLCVIEPAAEGHVLTAAILCFPASWTLSEKLGRAMPGIHAPVPEYGEELAKRVQRILDMLRPGQILWRANAHLHRDPRLFSPSREAKARHHEPRDKARFVRSERQTLRRLEGGAVVFTIHTYVIPLERLSGPQRAALGGVSLKSG